MIECLLFFEVLSCYSFRLVRSKRKYREYPELIINSVVRTVFLSLQYEIAEFLFIELVMGGLITTEASRFIVIRTVRTVCIFASNCAEARTFVNLYETIFK